MALEMTAMPKRFFEQRSHERPIEMIWP